MSAPAAAPKKEVDCLSPEAQKLAEARLAAKRAARAEAREIRMKELERQQKEVEEKPEKDCTEKGSRNMPGLSAATLASLGGTSSRRGSGDTSISLDTEPSIREIKDSLAEVEEKYKKAMVSNAQLDNEKTNFMYQVDTLKDVLLELEEQLAESRRQYEEKNKEFEREKHAHSILQFQFAEVKEALRQREEMLEKHGIIINSETATNGETPDLPNNTGHQGPAKVTTEQLSALRSPGDGPPGRTSGVEVQQDNVGQSGMAQDPKRPRPREDAAQDGVDRGVLQPGGSVEDQRTSGDSAPFPGSLGNARDEEQVENHIPDNTSFPERPEPAERREATTLSALGSGASLEEPGASPEEPGASPEEPGASLGEPGASLEEPGASPEEPGASPEEPGASPEEPGASLEEPGASLEEPGASPEEPGASPEEPGASPEEPGASLEEPGASLEEPGASPEEPGASLEEPGASLEEPGASPEEPGASPEEPGASLEEPGASPEEPGASPEEPGASSEEPSWAGASENQVPGAGNRPDIKNHSADSTGMQEEEKLEDLKNSSGGADPNLCPEPIAMETSGGDRTSRLDPMEQSRDHTGAMEEAGASHAGHRGTEATGSSRDSEDMASHDGSPEAPAPSTGQGPGKEPATQEGPVEGRGVSRENSAEEDGEAEVEAERVQGVAASPAAGDSHRQAQQATGAESSAVTTKEPEDKNEQQGEAMEPSQKKVKNKKKKNKKKKAATAAESQADTRKELACEEAEPGQAGDEQAGPADPDQAEEVQKEPLGDPEQETTAGSSENPECPGTPESTPDGKLHQEDGDTEATAGSITAEGDTRGLSSDTAQAPGSRASDEELNGNAMKADTEKDGAGSTLLEDASPLEELRDTSHTAGADTPAMCDQPSQTAGKAAGGHGSVEDGNLSAPEGEEGNSRVGAKGVSEKGRAKEDCTLS